MLKSKNSRTWIYGLSVFGWIGGCLAWNYIGTNTFYLSTAQAVIVPMILIHNNGRIVGKWLSSFAVFVAGNNLVDELFFAPWELNITEIVVGAMALMYYLNKYVPTIKYRTERWLKRLIHK